MLVYDLAHGLAKEIKESEEYRLLLQVKERINQSEGSRNMLEDFQKQQMNLQQAILKGEQISEEKTNQLEELNRILAANPLITEYRVAELRLIRLMGDVEKILWEAVQDAMVVKQEF